MTSKQKYKQFLRSEVWAALRLQCLSRDGEKCRKCGDTDGLHAHHLSYPSDWYETSLEHLITLCKTCHRLSHGLWIRVPMDDARKVIAGKIFRGERPPPSDWSIFKGAHGDEHSNLVLADLMEAYCGRFMRHRPDLDMAVKNSIRSRVPEFAHLAK